MDYMDFIIDTLFQIFFCFFWLIGVLVLLLKKENKKQYVGLIFLVPMLLIWSIYSYTNILTPRFKDVNYYINHDYQTSIGKCTIVNKNSKGVTPSIVLDEKIYYYNPMFNKISEGNSYKLKYLPNSKYVIDAEIIE